MAQQQYAMFKVELGVNEVTFVSDLLALVVMVSIALLPVRKQKPWWTVAPEIHRCEEPHEILTRIWYCALLN